MTDSETAVCQNDREKSFAATVNDMTEHRATVKNGGVTVFISVDEYAGAVSVNDLGKIVRAYGMNFYTASLTDGSEHIFRFGERTDV